MRSKPKPATHRWRKAGDMDDMPSDQHGVFVRTLTATEYQHFRETKELPKVGNISAVTDGGFGAFVLAARGDMAHGEIPAEANRSACATDRE